MKKKIGLLWHSFSSDNLGVGALSISHMALIDRVAGKIGLEPTYKVVGTQGGKNYLGSVTPHQAEISPFSLREIAKEPSQLRHKFSDCAVVFDLGEGDSFSDIYGMKRFLTLALSKFMVLRRSIPLVLSPQTIGPFKSPAARFLARSIMKTAAHTFPRDGLSRRYVEELGVSSNVTEVIDLAFGLPFVPSEKYALADGKVHVGLNVSGLLYNGGYSKNNQFGLAFDYRAFTGELIGRLQARGDVVVHLVSHVISDTFEVEDDYRTALAIQQSFPTCRVAPKFASPIEAKSYISGLDFFVGARMHATIAAFSSGVTVVPVAYSRKFEGLFNSLGYRWVVDATKRGMEESLALILEGMDRRVELQAEVTAGNQAAKVRLEKYEEYLVSLLRVLYAA
ncbi:hypothetical protein GMSM_17300 [Geomonas sp. Red276]